MRRGMVETEQKMNPLTVLRDIKNAFLDVVLGSFDPERDGLPPLKTVEKPEKPAPKRREKGRVHVIQGRTFREVTGENGEIEWENVSGKTATVADRSPYLSDADHDELERQGLDGEKAALIKPLWAEGLTVGQIHQALNGDAERYGLGQRTIETYTAAFGRAEK